MPSSGRDLVDLLNPDRLTVVADIGANPIDGDPPYKALLASRLCRLVGFEPQPHALTILNARKSDLETYLPYAVGSGEKGLLRLFRLPGMASLFEANPDTLKHFPVFAKWGELLGQVEIDTVRLDDIKEIDVLDFLKIDVQGSELAIFRSGEARLSKAVAIQTEVSFLPLYKNQPLYAEVDLELRRLGFVPHAFVDISKRMIAPMFGPEFSAFNQVFEADVVYVRDFTKPEAMDNEQLKHLAIVAHSCYKSYDLALNCIHHLQERGAIGPGSVGQYLNFVNTGAMNPQLARLARASA
jgi:FkbM family methyltransferase